ncbi:transposase [Jannaschia sp. M317]|nr:transposase [Jannaschia sp. M317]
MSDTFGASRRFHILAENDFCCRDSCVRCLRPASQVEGGAGSCCARPAYGIPHRIFSNVGTEFTNRAILKWANENDMDGVYINSGKPRQTTFIDAINGSLREELIYQELFDSLGDARRKLALWRSDYIKVRSHSSLNNQTPAVEHWGFVLSMHAGVLHELVY